MLTLLKIYPEFFEADLSILKPIDEFLFFIINYIINSIKTLSLYSSFTSFNPSCFLGYKSLSYYFAVASDLFGRITYSILAILFIILQGIEYSVSSFYITDGTYGSIFFFGTGFHGFHVMIGTAFIAVGFWRIYAYHVSDNNPLSILLIFILMLVNVMISELLINSIVMDFFILISIIYAIYTILSKNPQIILFLFIALYMINASYTILIVLKYIGFSYILIYDWCLNEVVCYINQLSIKDIFNIVTFILAVNFKIFSYILIFYNYILPYAPYKIKYIFLESNNIYIEYLFMYLKGMGAILYIFILYIIVSAYSASFDVWVQWIQDIDPQFLNKLHKSINDLDLHRIQQSHVLDYYANNDRIEGWVESCEEVPYIPELEPVTPELEPVTQPLELMPQLVQIVGATNALILTNPSMDLWLHPDERARLEHDSLDENYAFTSYVDMGSLQGEHNFVIDGARSGIHPGAPVQQMYIQGDAIEIMRCVLNGTYLINHIKTIDPFLENPVHKDLFEKAEFNIFYGEKYVKDLTGLSPRDIDSEFRHLWEMRKQLSNLDPSLSLEGQPGPFVTKVLNDYLWENKDQYNTESQIELNKRIEKLLCREGAPYFDCVGIKELLDADYNSRIIPDLPLGIAPGYIFTYELCEGIAERASALYEFKGVPEWIYDLEFHRVKEYQSLNDFNEQIRLQQNESVNNSYQGLAGLFNEEIRREEIRLEEIRQEEIRIQENRSANNSYKGLTKLFNVEIHREEIRIQENESANNSYEGISDMFDEEKRQEENRIQENESVNDSYEGISDMFDEEKRQEENRIQENESANDSYEGISDMFEREINNK